MRGFCPRGSDPWGFPVSTGKLSLSYQFDDNQNNLTQLGTIQNSLKRFRAMYSNLEQFEAIGSDLEYCGE